MSSESDKLRRQRDRFIAFAFAGADLLVELDADDRIRYCAGPSQALFGIDSAAAAGRPLADFIDRDDQARMGELLRRLKATGRMDRQRVRVIGGEGEGGAQILLSGIRVPESGAEAHLTFSRVQAHDAEPRNGDPGAPTPQGPEAFADLARQRLGEAEALGETYQMTMIDLSAEDLDQRLEADDSARFMASVEAYLKAWSVGGDSIGRLDNGKYGVIHDSQLKGAGIEERLNEMIGLFDPAGGGIGVATSTLDLDGAEMSADDIGRALQYTINQFVEEGGGGFAIRSLAEGHQAALDITLSKVHAFRQTIASDRLCLVFQPIVELSAWSVHHYEALARVRQGDRLFLPAKFINFAEDFGVITEFDLEVVRRTINILKNRELLRPKASVAVNLSGRSIANEAFVSELMLILNQNREVLSRLMFEVTESHEIKDLPAANQVLQRLRGLGLQISIDDFGSGAATFQYLKTLQVDYVKIDGSYIRDAFSTRHGKPFLKAISSLASDLGIFSIGEMVEDDRTMWLLRDIGVQYGQGYYFGKPMENVRNFNLSSLPERRRKTFEDPPVLEGGVDGDGLPASFSNIRL
ncbi:EAL domain-containing protein [Roseospirillum parvum]|uniref:EAL domain, c-di-GMP-specific phosphodiesterase class I (Or its enzymatically inactive variant) n=1 Tax=Roseospirillum parvum TaxID=83401 RepID=A0A1G7YMF4_9PROT|nr:EAL domain-containing protein [Roseospirillum parvum]SDG97708.1 EAL domain, c-di-GMP-specific phosphodiesterase class I (or its enzymatically inactive variant) [Roseospirillum parvum]